MTPPETSSCTISTTIAHFNLRASNSRDKSHTFNASTIALSNNNKTMLNPVVQPLLQRRGPRRFGCAFISAILLLSTMTLRFAFRLHLASFMYNKVDDEPQSSKPKKPTLLLHMGPPKTASSYLQCILTHMIDTLALDNYVFLGVHFDKCKKNVLQQALIPDCYDLFTQPGFAEFSPNFINDLRKANSHGQNAIIINECFKYFTPEQTKLLIDEFSSNWDVKLVMHHRRAFEFLPSYYNQGAKPKKEHGWQAMYLWPGEAGVTNSDVGIPLLPFDIEDRGHVTDVFLDMESNGGSFISELRQQYGEAFPDLNVIKLHELDNRKSGDAVLQEMFCRIVDKDSMPHSCAAVQLDETIKIGDLERNPYFSFNYDILGTAAYANHLFGFQKNATRTQYQREDVRNMIWHHQEVDLNLTHHDFETFCLDQEKMNRLLNASIKSEKLIYGSEWTSEDEVQHRHAFFAYQKKKPYTYCWINANKTLQDPTWLAFFESI
jgi:hypothetical protein